MRLLAMAAAAIAAAGAAMLLAAGCAATAGHPARSPAPLPPDQRTAAALLKIATTFSNDQNNGGYGPVYARWDARSQAIIAKAGYIRRHGECPGAGHVQARTEAVSPDRTGRGWCITRSAVSS